MKASAEAAAKLGADASWNPVDGYGVKVTNGACVDFGVALGLSPTLKSAVTALTVGADAVFGRVGAHADVDFSYKAGKFSAQFDVGGAIGLGYNVKFGIDVDAAKWAKNINYNSAIFYPNAHKGGDLNYSNPGAAFGQVLYSMFVSAPDQGGAKVLDYWVPPNSDYNRTTQLILWSSGTMLNEVSQKDAMNFFGDAIIKYADSARLKNIADNSINLTTKFHAWVDSSGGQIFENGRDFVEKLKAAHKFIDRDPTDPNSFSFTAGKNPVHDLSDRCQKFFPASNDPTIKAMELTFKGLPDGFAKEFKFIKDAKGEQTPDPTSAFAIFGQVSLVQYLSVKAFNTISGMEKPAMEAYLKSKACDYLTDESKTKLTAMWNDAYAAGALGNPYASGIKKDAEPVGVYAWMSTPYKWASAPPKNAISGIAAESKPSDPAPSPILHLSDTSFESKFWEAARSNVDGVEKKANFDKLYLALNTALNMEMKLPPGVTQVPDDTKSPRNGFDQALVHFKGIPMEDDRWHLIDFSAAKEGKVGLNDLIYDYTVKKLDTLKSPQAAFQFLAGPKSDWIADDGASRYTLFNEWWSKHGNDEWRTGTDPDALRSQAWFREHSDEIFQARSYR